MIHKLKTAGNILSVNTAGAKNMASLLAENRRLHKELSIVREEK
ncbi:MAG: hypothetical protein P1U74_04430 [Legionellaceae bacterium]|nr:hypothetical protein [Legionellaceae bacterium]